MFALNMTMMALELTAAGRRELAFNVTPNFLAIGKAIAGYGEHGISLWDADDHFFIDSPLQHDPYWQDQLLFHEYFHAETGQGLGASHQTGWTALVSMLVLKQLGS